jgi:hypothetical protein
MKENMGEGFIKAIMPPWDDGRLATNDRCSDPVESTNWDIPSTTTTAAAARQRMTIWMAHIWELILVAGINL